ncbi:DUF1080 domain-containing protein [bacterium]|nr:DUF1080 domain-containing protein [bacterium]
MKTRFAVGRGLTLLIFGLAATVSLFAADSVPLFDGRTFNGWEGNTNSVWRIEDGAIVGGSLAGNPQNEFLSTTKSYRNFRLTLEYKLVGTEGFVNGGVQFRSKRLANPPNEMSGFQADLGAGYSGCLYDESRRRITLVHADTNLIAKIEKPGDWNRYEIVATGPEIELTLNGQKTATWIERDPAIEKEGVIALQIHGNNKAQVSYRNIRIEVLPDSEVPPEGEVLSRFGDGQPELPKAPFAGGRFNLTTNEVVVFVGQENLVREQSSAALESLLAVGFADAEPRFRSMAWEADTVYEQWRDLNFGDWEDQLETADAGVVIAQFGQMEAFDGVGRLPAFETAYHHLLDRFATQTRRFVLISPMPFEKPEAPNAPDLTARNSDVAKYAEAVGKIARARNAIYVDLYTPLAKRNPGAPRLTHDGIHLTEQGLEVVAKIIADQLGASTSNHVDMAALRAAIVEKNRLWYDCWRPANWSFAYGDRVSQMFGKSADGHPSLKESFELRRPLIEKWDARIHALAKGDSVSKSEPETATASAPLSDSALPAALTPEEEQATFTLTDGYEVNLFASEADGVVNPTQFSWDERGRLYVACSTSYPQARANQKPSDYILVLEDTNGDGRADRSHRFAEGLTMVEGLEPGPDGLYVCDFNKLLYLRDADGDGRADSREVIFSGFGVGDTHQLVNSITHGPDGSLWFTQGLHAMSLVETPWGISRLDRAGVWRWRPRTMRLEGFFGGGMAGANCWGVAFDDYGQVFHKSGDRPQGYWTVPGMVRGANPAGSSSRISADQSYANSPEQYHSVGPLFDTSPKTTSLDIIGTRALPDDIQGCALIGGYFGSVVELHRFYDAGSGFRTTQLPRLMTSSSHSFRPVDVSVGPDGSIYLADWYNPIIGHYQASYADPRRDKMHGRIWRISAKGKAPVKQPDLASMSIPELLDQLRSPERWTRYQAKRLLFYKPTAKVVSAADQWLKNFSPEMPGYEHLLLEVTGVFQAHETVRPDLLKKLLTAKDFRVRAYGELVAGMWSDRLENPLADLEMGVRDENPRVRLCAVVAGSYLHKPETVGVVTEVLQRPMDPFLVYALRQSVRALEPHWKNAFVSGDLHVGDPAQEAYLRNLVNESPKAPEPGAAIFEATCLACHQPEGNGLPGVYPPLAGSDWVQGDTDRLIKVVLHGLSGPLTVKGDVFVTTPGLQMPSFAALDDQQIADVLSHVRSHFGNSASKVSEDEVKRVRAATADRQTPWTAPEL